MTLILSIRETHTRVWVWASVRELCLLATLVRIWVKFLPTGKYLYRNKVSLFIFLLLWLFFQANESIVAKTTVTVPSDGGPIEAVSTIETLPSWTRSRGKSGVLAL